jgi:predicted nucleic-acid-binding Zn-ribbon protein
MVCGQGPPYWLDSRILFAIASQKDNQIPLIRKKTVMKKDKKCPNCGCAEILMDARILDRGDNNRQDRELCVIVDGSPNAFIFKDRSYGVMTACICSGCGFTEIYTANARELYEKSMLSQHSGENTSH